MIMKYIKNTLILLLFAALFIPAAGAQNSIDINRMQRDIKIMENILEELFKTQWQGRDSKAHFAPSGNLFFRSGDDTRGTYLPGYGVIFTIHEKSPGFVTLRDSDNGDGYSYTFRYSDDSARKEITEENVTGRIKEFLREYGSTIGQLDADDRIMVIYNAGTHSPATAFTIREHASERNPDLPTISVVATKNDLEAYRSGKISASQLNGRFTVSTAGEDEKERLDLKVMSNIFETALKGQDDKAFRIRGSVNHLYLDNFGALFFFDARYTSSQGRFVINMPEVTGFSFSNEEKRARVEVESILRDELNESRQKQKETAEDIQKSYDLFISNLKEYLVDYGRTLSSVTSNQHIMISATIASALDEIPERVDLQISKSVLESTDRGNLSREEAMSKIVVREY